VCVLVSNQHTTPCCSHEALLSKNLKRWRISARKCPIWSMNMS